MSEELSKGAQHPQQGCQHREDEESGSNKPTQSTPPDEPPKKEAVDSQTRTPKTYKLKLLPGDKLTFEDPVTLMWEHGSYQIRPTPDYPVFLVNSVDVPSDNNFLTSFQKLKGDLMDIFEKVNSGTASGDDVVSSQQKVVQGTDSTAKPPVQREIQKPIEQESVKAEKAQHPKKPEEPAQQPKQTTPIAEKLIPQPKQQKPVTETLITQPDVEMNQPAVPVSQPTILNLAQKTIEPVPKQKQAKERVPQIQKPTKQKSVKAEKAQLQKKPEEPAQQQKKTKPTAENLNIFQKVSCGTSSGSDDVSSQQKVVQGTDSTAKPPVQREIQMPTLQKSVKAEKAQLQKKPEEPEEPAQQPKETKPIAEELVSQPKQQKTVTETLATQSDVEVNQPAEQVQKTHHAVEQDDGLSKPTHAAMVNKPKDSHPNIVNLAQKTTQPLPKQKQAKKRVSQVQQSEKQPDIESYQPTFQRFEMRLGTRLLRTPPKTPKCTQQLPKQKKAQKRVPQVQKPKEEPGVESNQPTSPVFKVPLSTRPIRLCRQQLPKQKQAQKRALTTVTHTERPLQFLPKVKPFPLIDRRTGYTWTFVGESSSGPSSSHMQAEQVQETPAKKHKESGTSVSKAKETRKPGKPTQSKIDQKAQEKEISKAFEEAQELKALQKPFDSYIKNHVSVRETLCRNNLQVDCVETNAFERSLLTYCVLNKTSDWSAMYGEVREFLENSKDEKKKSPEDKELVKKYEFLLDHLYEVVVQDVLAILTFHLANPLPILENDYFRLIFNPDRSVLVIKGFPREDEAAPKNPELEAYDKLIDEYVNRQNVIRSKSDLSKDPMFSCTELRINTTYTEHKDYYDKKLIQERIKLVKGYYQYWNWQHRQMKSKMQRNANNFMRLKFAYSMASRDVSDLSNNSLLFDTHILAGEQKGLYQDIPIQQLQHSERYLDSIFFPGSENVNRVLN